MFWFVEFVFMKAGSFRLNIFYDVQHQGEPAKTDVSATETENKRAQEEVCIYAAG